MVRYRVPFVDLHARAAEERDELRACVDAVIDSAQYILGPAGARFEAAAAAQIGVPHVIGLNSGTDALMLALWGLGVGKGDEVITTPLSFVATTAAIVHVGARPVYVDVGGDQLIDPARVEAAITPRTKAIVPVHWGGRVCAMRELHDIAARHGLLIVEDAAQAMGAARDGAHAGSTSAAAAFSAHPLKVLSALGDAGYLAVRDAAVAERIRVYRTHGLESRDNCVIYGVNSRLDELHAAVLERRLAKLAAVIDKRRAHVAQYQSLMHADQLRLPALAPGEQPAWTFMNARAERRDDLRAFLTERGIETLLYYGTPLHLHPAAAQLGYAPGSFPIAEAQCEDVIALPHHQYLTDDDIAYVVDQIHAFYAS